MAWNSHVKIKKKTRNIGTKMLSLEEVTLGFSAQAKELKRLKE